MVRTSLIVLILSSGCALRFGLASDRFASTYDADSDGDGISDVAEHRIGTNPHSADSDGDGVADGFEVGDINNPLDSDGDGIIDALDGATITVAPQVSDTGGGTTAGATGPTGSSGIQAGSGVIVDTGPPSVIPGFCSGVGPLTTIDGGVAVCGGDLAKAIFKYGICTCADLSLSNNFGTASLDVMAGTTPIGQAGNLGSNGDVIIANQSHIGGSVLHAGALVCGNGANLEVAQTYEYAAATGACVTATRTVHNTTPGFTPCGYCGASSKIDVASIAASFANNNDNASRGIPSTTFLSATTSDVSLTLSCGAYYFSEITPGAKFDLTITGRVAIFVGGDFTKSAGLTINFGADGELDLFIAGNMVLLNQTTIGDIDKPSRLRTYIGGTSFSTAQQSHLYGFFYAPNVNFTFANRTEVRGGIVTLNVTTEQNSKLYFDKSVFDLEGCVVPVTVPGGCTSNLQCAGGNPVCDADLIRLRTEAHLHGTSPGGLAAYNAANERIDITDLLPEVRVPTLVIHEPAFPFGSFELCQEVAAGIPNAEFVIVTDNSITGRVHDEGVAAFDRFLRAGTAAIGSTARAFGEAPTRLPAASNGLTLREVQVLRQVAAGSTNKEIASELGVAVSTVERHLVNLYTKIGARGRADAIAYALRHRLGSV